MGVVHFVELFVARLMFAHDLVAGTVHTAFKGMLRIELIERQIFQLIRISASCVFLSILWDPYYFRHGLTIQSSKGLGGIFGQRAGSKGPIAHWFALHSVVGRNLPTHHPGPCVPHKTPEPETPFKIIIKPGRWA